jgi:hypothetical protein
MSKKNNVDETDKYEVNTFLRSMLNKVFIHPILNSLPSSSQNNLRKTHRVADEVIENKTSHKALEVLYLGGYREHTKTIKQRIFYFIWMHTDNVKGVRNRLKMTEREIEKSVRYQYAEYNKRKFNILSIASGSARSFLEVLTRLNDLDDMKVHLTFLDKSPEALEYSKSLFQNQSFGHERYTFEWVNDTANNYLNNLPTENKYAVVEMVGLMDYFDDEKVVQTVTSIYNCLEEKGCLVTANIIPNNEQRFVTKAVGWRMIYRQPIEFVHLITLGHFNSKDVISQTEPMEVHTVVTAVKS